jgi:aminopeptidase-like protein
MANNELSGPVLATAIARWISTIKDRRYTYRFSFAPETIGAITYISKNIDNLKKNVIAAFNLTCVGNPGEFSFMPSRQGETLADKVALTILEKEAPNFKRFTFLDRGSDERQYCSPGVDLPMITIMRTRYGDFPEYHTSLDNLDFITQEALEGTLLMHQKCINLLEQNKTWKTVLPCEPHLSKHNLYPDINKYQSDYSEQVNILNFLAYADGNHNIVDLAQRINIDTDLCLDLANKLFKARLIQEVDH